MKEQSDWFGAFANHILTYISAVETMLTSAERLSFILMMISNEDKMPKILSFVGNSEFISVKEIATVLGDIQSNADLTLLGNKKVFDKKSHGKKKL